MMAVPLLASIPAVGMPSDAAAIRPSSAITEKSGLKLQKRAGRHEAVLMPVNADRVSAFHLRPVGNRSFFAGG
jgi:hypothetical protein